MSRVRHDPKVSAPIDGDYNRLAILNKDPTLHYVYADDEDAAMLKFEGYGVVSRREGGEKPTYDTGGPEGEAIRVKNLVLMAAPVEVKARRDARPKAEFDDRNALLGEKVKRLDGKIDHDHVAA